MLKQVVVVRKTIKPLGGSQDSLEERDRSDSGGNNRSAHDKDEAFQKEERILTLLRSLRHPNITPLLASYTTQKTNTNGKAHLHHLLFPLADCDLSAVLKSRDHDALNEHFATDYILFEALYGLASALESVHNYVSEEFNLTMIGCHYDLNPRNILVKGDKLLLADFGLSRLQPEGSRSLFKRGKGDYLAPECEPLVENTFSKGIVGREGDVWSFGCVLLEILTYRLWKGREVEAFRTRRKSKLLGCYTAYQFHAFGKAHPAVEEEIKCIREESSDFGSSVLGMIEQMLSIDSKLRPKVSHVTACLFVFALKTLYQSCCEMLSRLATVSCNLQCMIEQQRLVIWGWGAAFVADDAILEVGDGEERRGWLSTSRERWDAVDQTLRLVAEEIHLLEINVESGPMLRPMYTRIRDLNDRLWSFPPSRVIQRLTQVLHDRMTSSYDLGDLGQTRETFQTDSHYRDIALLATIKYMIKQVNGDIKSGTRRLLVNDSVQIGPKVGTVDIGTVTKNGESRPVVIEWMEYGPHWMNKDNREELFDRVEAVAELFCRAELPRRIMVLHCSNYYHHPTRHSFGLLYDFPTNAPQDVRPFTLEEVLSRFARPLLGNLYELARGITECVLNIHKVGWLHKNISAYSILFFETGHEQQDAIANRESKNTIQSLPYNKPHSPARSNQKLRHRLPVSEQKPKKARTSKFLGKFQKRAGTSKEPIEQKLTAGVEQDADFSQLSHSDDALKEGLPRRLRPASLKTPYVVGFNHGRPDKDLAFTEGPSTDRRQIVYQHPDYTLQSKRRRFRSAYDYYSLGLLLLEIGLWKPLSDMPDNEVGSYTPTEQRDLWLKDFVPRLGATMGAIYRDAVESCLNGDLDDEFESKTQGSKPLMLFQARVVDQIEGCCA